VTLSVASLIFSIKILVIKIPGNLNGVRVYSGFLVARFEHLPLDVVLNRPISALDLVQD
jgi:uncharacterized membrane protein